MNIVIKEIPKTGGNIENLAEKDKASDIELKKKIFYFIVGTISIQTLAILFLPYVSWIYPDFEIDPWALRLLIVGMLAQPYLILRIITTYLFSK